MAGSDEGARARPKVLLLGGDGGRSGVPRHLEHLLKACAGQAKFVVAAERDRGGYAFLARSDTRLVHLPGLATRLRPLQMLVTARRLVRLIAREAPVLVWAHARMAVLLLHLLVLAGWQPAAGQVLAITYHGLPFGPGHRPVLSFLSLRLERAALSRGPARHLIFLSEAALATFRAAVGARVCARHACSVQPNSSTLGEVAAPPAPGAARHLLVAGRVSRQKNLDRALRIFAELPGSYRLLLAGEGTGGHDFRRRARAILGDQALRRVEFAGQVDDLRPWMARADCYLLTSRYEGDPIGALEASEAGLPLALPDIPGCRSLLESHPHAAALTGRHGDDGDPVEDAIRILQLAEGHARQRHRQRARIRAEWARRHGFRDWSVAMRALVARLIGEEDGGAPAGLGPVTRPARSAPGRGSASVVVLATRRLSPDARKEGGAD